MAQGWFIDPSADTITFNEAPPVGVNNVVVIEYPSGGKGGTDVWALGAWSTRFGYPREVEFYSDRLWFASTPTDPQTLWASVTGDYPNFGRSSPIVDSDALTYTINSRQVNVIKELIPLDNLIANTTGGEFKVTGGADDVVAPSTIFAKPQGSFGSGDVPAVVIGDSAVYMQNEGQKARDMRYQFEKDGFRGADFSVWGEHLFTGYTFTGLEYWKAPWSVLWFSRSDGIRVGCTYLPEQEVVGFHWHDTVGSWRDACSLPGVTESDCYFLARRVINGETVQYIEQQAPTRYDDEDDLFYVDAGLTYDGRNSTATTLTLTATGWTEDDDLTITASAALFVGTSDVGDAFLIRRTVVTVVDGLEVSTEYEVRVIIDDYTSATVVHGHSVGTVPAELRAVATDDWTFQRDTIGDLWHLEGKPVTVLQDAAVSGPFTVTNGSITLGEPGGVVHVGIAYTAELETLELNAPGGEPYRDASKLAYKVALLVLGTRGVSAGSINGPLYPIKERTFEDFGQPPFLKTGIIDMSIPATWGQDAGRIRVQSTDPLPMEILSLTVSAIGSNKP